MSSDEGEMKSEPAPAAAPAEKGNKMPAKK